MSIKVRVGDHEVLPKGTYDGRFMDVEKAESDTGDFWKWTFDVDHDGALRPITAASSQKLTRNTKAGAWVSAILGRQLEPGEDFDFASMKGKACRLVLSIEDTTRGTFNRVDEVLPPLRNPEKVSAGEDVSPF
jgi:hypothetical protein